MIGYDVVGSVYRCTCTGLEDGRALWNDGEVKPGWGFLKAWLLFAYI